MNKAELVLLGMNSCFRGKPLHEYQTKEELYMILGAALQKIKELEERNRKDLEWLFEELK